MSTIIFNFFVKPSQQHLTVLTTITTIHGFPSLVNTFLIFYSFFYLLYYYYDNKGYSTFAKLSNDPFINQ